MHRRIVAVVLFDSNTASHSWTKRQKHQFNSRPHTVMQYSISPIQRYSYLLFYDMGVRLINDMMNESKVRVIKGTLLYLLLKGIFVITDLF